MVRKAKRKRKQEARGPADALLAACRKFSWSEDQRAVACAAISELFAESGSGESQLGVHRRRLAWANSAGISRRLLECVDERSPLAVQLHAVGALINLHAVGGAETCEHAVQQEGAMATLAAALERAVATLTAGEDGAEEEARKRAQLLEQLLVLLNDMCHGAVSAVDVFTARAGATLPAVLRCVALVFGGEGGDAALEPIARAAAMLLHTATDGNAALAIQLLAAPDAARMLDAACAREAAHRASGAARTVEITTQSLTCLHFTGAMAAAWEASVGSSSSSSSSSAALLTPIARVLASTLGAERAKGARFALPPAWPPARPAAASASAGMLVEEEETAAADAGVLMSMPPATPGDSAAAAARQALLPWTQWTESLTLALELLANLSIMAPSDEDEEEEEEEEEMGSSSSGGNVANEQLCAALGAARSVEATLGALGDGWDCLMVATRAAEPTSVSRKGVRAAHDEVDPAIAGVLDAVSSLCSRAVSCLDNLAASLPPGHFPCNDVWVALSRMLQTQTLVDPECTVPPSAITSALWTLLRRVDSATIAPTSEEFMRFAVLLQTDGGVDRETRLHSAGIFVVLACRLGDAAKGASDAAAATASSVDATAAIVLKALASIDVLAAAVSGEASLPPSPSTMLVVSEVVMGSFDIYGTPPGSLHDNAFRSKGVAAAMEAAEAPLVALLAHFDSLQQLQADDDGEFGGGADEEEMEATASAAERLQDVVSNLAPFVAFKRGQL